MPILHWLNRDKTIEEKELIGKVWAEKLKNLFLMAWKKDGNGNDIRRQINEGCKS